MLKADKSETCHLYKGHYDYVQKLIQQYIPVFADKRTYDDRKGYREG